jgi:poly [ADP-ribose] polymerase 6/8
MPDKKQISELRTEHQYMTVMDSPERDADFRMWRKEYGSYFAFHGSGNENWHSILRKGLKNMSGTKFMTAGAAFGPGVYLSPSSTTSMGYSRQVASPYSKSEIGKNGLKALAIVEVVKAKGVPTIANPHYVVKEDIYLTPRFVMFYSSNNQSLSITIASIEEKLRQFVQ